MNANSIDSINTVFDLECKTPERKIECERFRIFLQQANTVDLIDFAEVDGAFDVKFSTKAETTEIPVEMTIIKE